MNSLVGLKMPTPLLLFMRKTEQFNEILINAFWMQNYQMKARMTNVQVKLN